MTEPLTEDLINKYRQATASRLKRNEMIKRITYTSLVVLFLGVYNYSLFKVFGWYGLAFYGLVIAANLVLNKITK